MLRLVIFNSNNFYASSKISKHSYPIISMFTIIAVILCGHLVGRVFNGGGDSRLSDCRAIGIGFVDITTAFTRYQARIGSIPHKGG